MHLTHSDAAFNARRHAAANARALMSDEEINEEEAKQDAQDAVDEAAARRSWIAAQEAEDARIAAIAAADACVEWVLIPV